MLRFLRFVLYGCAVVGLLSPLCWACTPNYCESPCNVITYLHVDGDGMEYVGGKATLIDHRPPSIGGKVGPPQNITVKFWDLMCFECADCIGSTCEGSNPGSLLLTTTASHPTTCIIGT